MSSITNEVGERKMDGEKEVACVSTWRERQSGSWELRDGRVENGGDGEHWKEEEEEEEERGGGV